MCHSQIPISKHVSFSMLLWHGFAMVAASLYYLVGQRGSGSLPQCAWVVYGPDGVSADRRGIEPDFSMGRNRPLCQMEGEERGAMWGMWGSGSQHGPHVEEKGHMWPVCTWRICLGERGEGSLEGKLLNLMFEEMELGWRKGRSCSLRGVNECKELWWKEGRGLATTQRQLSFQLMPPTVKGRGIQPWRPHGDRVSHVWLLHDSPSCWFTFPCCHSESTAGGQENLDSAMATQVINLLRFSSIAYIFSIKWAFILSTLYL